MMDLTTKESGNWANSMVSENLSGIMAKNTKVIIKMGLRHGKGKYTFKSRGWYEGEW
jgi:maltose-binding protein MalE